MSDDIHRVPREKEARERAMDNVENWGQQPPIEIVAAIVEEVGELVDEVLATYDDPPENDDVDALMNELWDVNASGTRVREHLQALYQDDGEPLPEDERPSLAAVEREDIDVEEARDELLDLEALLYQLDWAFYQDVRAGDRDG